jgi:NadR type nicotinamide-nucleotide adenylyltransferase
MAKTHQQAKQNITKVVFYGPESTGKTTLAEHMANLYNTEWVPEYSRAYLQKKYDETGLACEIKDLLPIANGQLSTEKKHIEKANKFLFCDTNILELFVYANIYFPKKKFPKLKKMALEQNYDYWFLTDIDVPWENDDLRDRPHKREEIFATFRDFLIKYDKKFVILSGELDERIKTVKSIIENH